MNKYVSIFFCIILGASNLFAEVLINPVTRSFDKLGGGAAILTTGSGSWTATTSDSWITIVDPGSGTAGSACIYIVSGNLSADTRAGTININGNIHTVNQTGYEATLTPSSRTIDYNATTDIIAVSAPAGVSWTAQSSEDWVTLSPASGISASSVSYAVEEYSGVTDRTAILTIAGENFTLTQTGIDVNIAPRIVEKDHNAGIIQISVSALFSSTWTVVPNDPWISVVDSGPGAGDYVITLAIGTNPSYDFRDGTVDIGTSTLSIKQLGNPYLNLNINPISATANPVGAYGNVAVLATPDSPWSSTSLDPWITIDQGSTGEGNGNIQYVVSANPTLTERTGRIKVIPPAVAPLLDLTKQLFVHIQDGSEDISGWGRNLSGDLNDEFNGTNDKVLTGQSFARNDDAMSVSIRFNVSQTGMIARLFGVQRDLTSFSGLYLNSSDRLVFQSDNEVLVTDKILEANQDYRVILTVDETNKVSVYCAMSDEEMELIGSKGFNEIPLPNNNYISPSNFRVGAAAVPSAGVLNHTTLNDLRIYGRCLSQYEAEKMHTITADAPYGNIPNLGTPHTPISEYYLRGSGILGNASSNAVNKAVIGTTATIDSHYNDYGTHKLWQYMAMSDDGDVVIHRSRDDNGQHFEKIHIDGDKVVNREDFRWYPSYGKNVAISGDGSIIAAGAQNYDNSRGIVRIWKINENGSLSNIQDIDWRQYQNYMDYFGQDVALNEDGSVLAVACHGQDLNGLSVGAAYIYERANNSWVQSAMISPTNLVQDDTFGFHIDLNDSGDIVLVSMSRGNTDRTGVYCYQKIGDNWELRGNPITNNNIRTVSGVSLSGNGDVVAFNGALDGENSYGVSVYKYNGFDWQEVEYFYSDPDSITDRFAFYPVRISGNGKRLVVGDHEAGLPAINSSNNGAVYLYDINDEGLSLVDKNMGGGGETLGISMAIDYTGQFYGAGAPGYASDRGRGVFFRSDFELDVFKPSIGRHGLDSNALRMEVGSQRIKLENADLFTSNDATYNIWLKIDNEAKTSVFGDMTIFSHGPDNLPNKFRLMYDEKTNKIKYRYNNDLNYVFDYTFERNKWYMLTMSSIYSGVTTFYIDGQEIGNVDQLGSHSFGASVGIDYSLKVGGWSGEVDYIGIYDNALTSAQITEIYDNQAPTVIFHTVTQGAITPSISPSTGTIIASGGTASTDLTLAGNVIWSAQANDSWLSVSSPLSGAGSILMSVVAEANPTVYDRVGTATIAGEVFTVTQQGLASVVTSDDTIFGTDGGSAWIDVSTEGLAQWQAISQTDWLTVALGATGQGGGQVFVVASPITQTATSRIGSVVVAGKTVYFTQRGYELSITPQVAQVGSNAGAGEF
ncbi:MAG: BACON domain-containing protein, partial [Pontiellaceae bacterium]